MEGGREGEKLREGNGGGRGREKERTLGPATRST